MAVQYIDELNKEDSTKKYAIIDLEDLHLDKRNPRFSSSTIIGDEREIGDKEIIEYLLQYGRIYELAQSINRNSGLYEEEWISCYRNKNNEIIVLEGNRRVATCKILKDSSWISDAVRENILIPSANNEKTLENISKVKAIIYDDEKDAQLYIAAKHTKPEIKRWETVEQCNYYYEQFMQGIAPQNIGSSVGEETKKVKEKIKQFGLFKKVFNVVKEKYPELLIEDIYILPLITRFFPPILSVKGDLGLGISCDEDTLIYSVKPEGKLVFDKILLKIGEAFFVRPKMREISGAKRFSSDTCRISSDEIKTKKQVEKLVIDDIRIPGLYNLLLEYKNSEKKVTDEINTQVGQNQDESHKVVNSNNNEGSKGNLQNKKNSLFEKTSEFFADIDCSKVDPTEHRGVVLVCEEIKKISMYNSGNAYKQFPIASAFLLRSLIEQVLAARLKQIKRYDVLCKKNKSPELGVMIAEYLKDYQNGNMSLFWDDKNLGREFNKCFSGYGTKDQLDTIIHNPHMIQPEKNFLNSLSNQGLKYIMQEFLNKL